MSGEKRVWQPVGMRVSGISLIVMGVGALVSAVVLGIVDHAAASILLAIMGVGIGGCGFAFLGNRIELADETLTIVNYWFASPLSARKVVSARVDTAGTVFVMSDGERVRAAAVATSPLNMILGRRSRADEVADEIGAAARGTREWP